MSNASIAQELAKIRNKWESINTYKWDMAIWVCDYHDIEILDKFMDIEASPIGVFEDIFFRFQSVYSDDFFEQHLWAEFLSWFNTSEDKKYDLIHAYKKDGYLPESYDVNRALPPTFKSVVGELKRLKDLLPFKEENFILYFAPGMHGEGFDAWLSNQLSGALPKDFRLAAIDVDVKRKLSKLQKHKSARVVELRANLDMANAMRNEMDKDSDSVKPHSPSTKFQKQVRKVMDATIDDDINIKKEAKVLIELGYQLKKLTTKATAHLICAIAFFNIKNKDSAFENANKAIELAEPEIEKSDEAYPIWRSALMIKASLYLVDKKTRPEAISCYEKLVAETAKHGDVFYTMEGYRMLALVNFQSKNMEAAWEHVIFSLQAGTNLPLEIKRASTYLFSASLAKQICDSSYKYKSMDTMLNKQFETEIGTDWDTLLQGTEYLNLKYVNRRKPLKV